MGAVVLADPGVEARAGGKRRYALPALLVAGWIALLGYSAAYLTEDLPLRPQAADSGRPMEGAPAAPPDAAPRRVVVLGVPEAPEAAEPAREAAKPAPEAARPAPGPPPAAGARTGPIAPPVATPVRPSPGPVSAEYVGVWGPTAFACGAPSHRRGFLPATITPDRAKAGRTLCSFHDGRRTGGAWVMAAECSDRGRHWSSQVRLVVDGDRLTWSSSRGTSTYIRCRRAG